MNYKTIKEMKIESRDVENVFAILLETDRNACRALAEIPIEQIKAICAAGMAYGPFWEGQRNRSTPISGLMHERIKRGKSLTQVSRQINDFVKKLPDYDLKRVKISAGDLQKLEASPRKAGPHTAQAVSCFYGQSWDEYLANPISWEQAAEIFENSYEEYEEE